MSDDPPVPPDETASADGFGGRLHEVSAPLFRTLPTPVGRKGIRLEAAFWDALEVQAHAAGQRRSVYAGNVLAQAQAAGINATSALRSLVVADLTAEVKRQRPVTALPSMLRLLQMAPVPSFALDQQKRLLQVNGEFGRYIRAINGNRFGGAPTETAQLSLDRPIEVLFGELTAAATTECGITIRVDNRERRSTARFILVPPLPAVALIGYVLS